MDVHLLLAERQRQRLAEQFPSTYTCLSILRAQLIGASTDEARQHLKSAVARELGEKLLALDASILELHQPQRRLTSDSALRLRTSIRAMFEAEFRAVL